MRLSVTVAILVGLVVAGCVTTSPVPEGYTGPTATIHDSVRSESGTRAVLFFVSEIDGRQIETSLARTRGANYGRGFALAPVAIERKIPAKHTILKLEGQTAYGAPIQEIVMASQMYNVTAIVEFDPKPDRRYVVQGILEEGKASVWLEDELSHQRVGKIVRDQAK
jgi:hypothetical protein